VEATLSIRWSWGICGRRPFRTRPLPACFAKWHCGGDCYYKTLRLNGNGDFAGAGRCRITRELTKDQLLGRIAAAGGLFWREASQPCPVLAAGHTQAPASDAEGTVGTSDEDFQGSCANMAQAAVSREPSSDERSEAG